MVFAYAFLGLVVLLNLVVTVAVLRDAGLYASQKIGQIIFVWLIPILGATITFSLMAGSHSREELRGLVPFPFYLLAADIGLHSRSGDSYDSDASMIDGMSDGGSDAD